MLFAKLPSRSAVTATCFVILCLALTARTWSQEQPLGGPPQAAAANANSGLEIPAKTAEIAAFHYAEQRRQGCRLISITPYFALDGSVNAYAFQYAAQDSAIQTEEDLAERAAQGDEALRLFLSEEGGPSGDSPRKYRPSPTRDYDPAAPQYSGARLVEIDDSPAGHVGAARLSLDPSRLEAANHIQGNTSLEMLRRQGDRIAWLESREQLAREATLSGEILTVVISARRDLYPLLERFEGVAPHIAHRYRVSDAADVPQSETEPIQRTFYLGPMAVYHEPSGSKRTKSTGGLVLVEPESGDVLQLDRARLGAEAGRLPSAPSKRRPDSPEEAWWSIEKTGALPLPGDRRANPPAGAYTIPGVPYYIQDDYAPRCCAQCASAQALGYWDDHGYGNLIDNGSSATGHEDELIFVCMKAMGYEPDSGTGRSDIGGGLRDVIGMNMYGNALSFSVSDRDGDNSTLKWYDDIRAELDSNKPFVYSNYDKDEYPNWAHSTTAVGYDDTNPDRILLLHYNYYISGHKIPFELNWDNVSGDNERMQKITPTMEPFDCLWSEDFEGSFPGPWSRISLGSTLAFLHTTFYRARITTGDPRPPGGDPSFSLYGCVASGLAAPGPYPANANTALIYGPFSTLGRTSGEIAGTFMNKTAGAGDGLAFMASTNGVDFQGLWWERTSGTEWKRGAMLLNDVPVYGNLMGLEKVWVAIWFYSNDDDTVGEGAYVDNVTIRLGPAIPWPLASPANVSATNGTQSERIRVDWNPVPGATHYRVQARVMGGQYEDLTGWRTERPFDFQQGCEPGVDYAFRVQAAESPTGTRASSWSAPEKWGWARLRSPTDVTATDGTYIRRVAVSWTADADTSRHYRVHRSEHHEVGFAPVSGWIASNRYEDVLVTPGKTYYYRVEKAGNASGFRPSPLSLAASGWGKLNSPDPNATDGLYADRILVTWPPTTGAAYYQVFRGTHPEAVPDPVSGWVHTTYFVDEDLEIEPTTTYYYRVKAALDSEGYRASGWGNYDTGWMGLAAPASLSATQGTESDFIRLTWDAVPGARYYWVWASTDDDEPLVPLSWAQSETSFDDVYTYPGMFIYYWVKAAWSSSGYHSSPFAGPVKGWRRPAPPAGVEATHGLTNLVRVSWETVSGASFYQVSRAESPDALSWTVVADNVEATAFDDVPPERCRDYYYWVVAVGADSIASERGGPAAGSLCLEGPAGVKAADGESESGVLVTWPAVSGATHYRVYRGLSPSATGKFRQPISEWESRESLLDRSAQAGVLYYYWVLAASDATGSCASEFGVLDSGWRAPAAPTRVQASDGEYTDMVRVTWDPAFDGAYYRVYRAASSSRIAKPVGSWSTTIGYDDSETSETETYGYWVRSATEPEGERPSGYSLPDTGWRAAGKQRQSPNMNDGFGVAAYAEGTTRREIEVIDDWECSDGSPIRRIHWWGVYHNWHTDSAATPPDPEQPPDYFFVTWYPYASGHSPDLAPRLSQEKCSAYHQEWKGAIAIPVGRETAYMHVYQFTCELKEPWEQDAGEQYFLSIQAAYPAGLSENPWLWLNSSDHWSSAAFQNWLGAGFEELFWPDGHRLEGRPMDMAFELVSGPPSDSGEYPTPTPTATLTPLPPPTATPMPTPPSLPTATSTPSPTPTSTPVPSTTIWSQEPAWEEGRLLPSWSVGSSRMETMAVTQSVAEVADDFRSEDGRSVVTVRFPGGYIGWHEDEFRQSPSPAEDRPDGFIVTWYRASSDREPLPAEVLAMELCRNYEEVWVRRIPIWDNPALAIHAYGYTCRLETPWRPARSEPLFLSIRAFYESDRPTYPWGWLCADAGSLFLKLESDAALERTETTAWTPLYWPDGSRLSERPVNMAFTLETWDGNTPTPTPRPPTPTPTTTPTPETQQPDRSPDLTLGLGFPSWTDTAQTTGSLIVDDVLAETGDSVLGVRWWGAYRGWNPTDPLATAPPGSLAHLLPNSPWPDSKPLYFHLTLLDEDFLSAPFDVGMIHHEEYCRDFTETWRAAIPNWYADGEWSHVFEYTAQLENPWNIEPNTPYFVGIQAAFSTDSPEFHWEWVTTGAEWRSPALLRLGVDGPWEALAYPFGHPLSGSSPNCAFELSSKAFETAGETALPASAETYWMLYP